MSAIILQNEQRAIGNRTDEQKSFEIKPFKTKYAFIIGINQYQFVTSLKTPINDASTLAKVLSIQHNFKVHDVLKNPTKTQLEDFLRNMSNYIGADDAVVFYFAGHGIALEDDKGMSGYIVPADAKANERDSLIPMSFLNEVFESLPCRHFLLILDCCFAGAIRWASTKRDVNSMFMPKLIYKERYERYIKDRAWQVLASASHDQKAFDSFTGFDNARDADGNHSPFALALFDALSGKGDIVPADGGDGIITATEMYLYLRQQVELPTAQQGWALQQTPSIFTLPKHDNGEFIFFSPNHRLNLPPIPKRNPFKGLQSFDEADKDLFYGREQVVEDLWTCVDKLPLTVVTGASGTGKSSLVKAGLIPVLREKGYDILGVIRPSQKKLDEVLNTSHLTTINEPPTSGGTQLSTKQVLVIDQFEELLTQSTDEERLNYIGALRSYIASGLKVIVTVRSDFEPQFQTLNWSDWISGRFVVPPFSVEELREAIVRPSVQEVLQFEPANLIDKIVQEVVQSPGALPLLSFTLSELYELYVKSGRNDRILAESDYNILGGVIGSLRKKADDIYASLDTAQQNSMRNLMLRMVSLTGGEYTGKRVLKNDLVFKDTAETERTQNIVSLMLDARLLVSGNDNDGHAYFEPAHDALVRAWTKLSEWVKTRGDENVVLQNKLTEAVEDYYKSNQNKKNLWHHDPRLDILKKQDNSWMNAQEQTFLEQSIALKKRDRFILRAIVTAAFVFISGFGIFALIERNLATKNAETAKNAQKRAEDSAVVAKDQRSIAESARKAALDSAIVAKNERSIAQSNADTAKKRLNQFLDEQRQKDKINFEQYYADGVTTSQGEEYLLSAKKFKRSLDLLEKYKNDSAFDLFQNRRKEITSRLDSANLKSRNLK